MEAHTIAFENPFHAAEQQFTHLVDTLGAEEQMDMTHDELENFVLHKGNEVLRLLLQGHLDVRSRQVAVGPIVGNEGVRRRHRRVRCVPLKTLVGEVKVTREVFGTRGCSSLAPLDAQLNLPAQKYSLGVQKRVVIEGSKGSFDEAVASIERGTATTVPKRQAEQIVQHSMCDFEAFYTQRQEQAASKSAAATDSILVITTDGKGVAMRKKDLREPTRKAAEKRQPKLQKRQSKGEKRHTKRMAMVAAVYGIAPFIRKPEDIMRELRPIHDVSKQRPRPEDKRVWASVEQPAQGVMDEAFKEALSRDPQRSKQWVGLVDGNETQLGDMLACAEHYGVKQTIIIDFIHVLEYVWKAAWGFYAQGDKRAEQWVTERLIEILRGRASTVAGGMRRCATRRGMLANQRAAVDDCADYLVKYADYLHYDQYLAAGFPIATGVIEGACRHLVQDRMGITGARWRLAGAEAVLRARAVRSSGDFEAYWGFHQQEELRRNHTRRYAQGRLPTLKASDKPVCHLRIVK